MFSTTLIKREDHNLATYIHKAMQTDICARLSPYELAFNAYVSEHDHIVLGAYATLYLSDEASKFHGTDFYFIFSSDIDELNEIDLVATICASLDEVNMSALPNGVRRLEIKKYNGVEYNMDIDKYFPGNTIYDGVKRRANKIDTKYNPEKGMRPASKVTRMQCD